MAGGAVTSGSAGANVVAAGRVLVVPSGDGVQWQMVDASGLPVGPVTWAADPVAEVRQLELQARPRWIWWRTAEMYPALLEAGVRVERCHDLAAVENLLRTYEGEPFVPPQSVVREPVVPGRATQISLFGEDAFGEGSGAPTEVGTPIGSGGATSGGPGSGLPVAGEIDTGMLALPDEVAAWVEELDEAGPPVPGTDRSARGEQPHGPAGLLRLYAAQVEQIADIRSAHPGFPLLVAAESAVCLAAVEMGRAGLPWSVRIHDEVLTELLGPRPAHHGRPRKLQTLAEEVSRELAPGSSGPGLQVNPDSPAEVLKALRRQGVTVDTTRAWELKGIDHPAVPPLLRYKELARLHVAHGWAWQDQWVSGGRFRAEYVPGGVVTGRWATSGGGALQIPKVMRACVVADPGWVLVAADAGQLEPRILAALSGDRGMIAATADPDMYTALARQALGKPEARNEAKIGLLAAMYGARANSLAMVALRRRFPQALDLLERAARTGEDGGIVRSVLGRTCPPPEPTWQDGPPEQALARSRARGRFTRNFVIQASAADWANALVAGLRRRLSAMPDQQGRAELVFFQHDEVIVHAPAHLAGEAVAAIVDSGSEATSLVLGDRGVRIPLAAAPIASYAEKN